MENKKTELSSYANNFKPYNWGTIEEVEEWRKTCELEWQNEKAVLVKVMQQKMEEYKRQRHRENFITCLLRQGYDPCEATEMWETRHY